MSHPIATISFRPPSLDCACGAGLSAETPDELDAAYRAHRAAVGATHEANPVPKPKLRAEHQRVPWDGTIDYIYAANDWLWDR
jgi:hypothetical protein